MTDQSKNETAEPLAGWGFDPALEVESLLAAAANATAVYADEPADEAEAAARAQIEGQAKIELLRASARVAMILAAGIPITPIGALDPETHEPRNGQEFGRAAQDAFTAGYLHGQRAMIEAGLVPADEVRLREAIGIARLLAEAADAARETYNELLPALPISAATRMRWPIGALSVRRELFLDALERLAADGAPLRQVYLVADASDTEQTVTVGAYISEATADRIALEGNLAAHAAVLAGLREALAQTKATLESTTYSDADIAKLDALTIAQSATGKGTRRAAREIAAASDSTVTVDLRESLTWVEREIERVADPEAWIRRSGPFSVSPLALEDGGAR